MMFRSSAGLLLHDTSTGLQLKTEILTQAGFLVWETEGAFLCFNFSRTAPGLLMFLQQSAVHLLYHVRYDKCSGVLHLAH